MTYCLLIENHFGRSPNFFLVLLFDGLALLILSPSIKQDLPKSFYPSFLPTPTRRAFTVDPLVRLQTVRRDPDRGRSR